MVTRSLFAITLMIISITACSFISIDSRRDDALSVASKAGFKSFSLSTDKFTLAGFHRLTNPKNPISIYIEGDGLAWIDKYTVSTNPTPTKPMLLKLAIADQAKNIIYIARPCQYVKLNRERSCHRRYWTSHRFSEEVIPSYMQAFEMFRKIYGNKSFHLVGYSGGGAIAALLAVRRSDILSLRTIAGNLDHAALNKARRVSPLSGSLNPIFVAHKLKSLPQIHYAGSDDTVVPEWVGKSFESAVGGGMCVKTRIVSGAVHTDGWLPAWKSLSREIPRC